METYFGDQWVVRLGVQRGLAAIYFVAFLSALNQFRPLLGDRGLLPVAAYLRRVDFRSAPSLFHLGYSDRRFGVVAWTGLALSTAAMTGFSDNGPIWLSMAVWLALYALYLSIVNVGQAFYGFGWESMLLEAGFFAAFLAPSDVAPSLVPILCLRWMLFRVELGAGLIKLRHDPCWRDLTCLYYHYETQPIPNPLSVHFHRMPKSIHRFSVIFSHFVQVVVPFGLLLPQPIASIAGGFIVIHQLLLIVSGNYAWLNWLTVVLGITAFSDQTLGAVVPITAPALEPRPFAFDVVLWVLALMTVLLSIKPTLNLFSKHQAMNASYNPFHIVGSYGAFGSVTKKRYEIVLEGTSDEEITDATEWKAYELKGKPGDPRRRPRQWAPYHLRLDWLMWFLPFGAQVGRSGVRTFGYDLWFIRLVQKLLEGDRAIRALLSRDPFGETPPRFVRASFYHYEFASAAERRATKEVWKRTRIDDYLPAVARRPSFGRSRGADEIEAIPLVPATT